MGDAVEAFERAAEAAEDLARRMVHHRLLVALLPDDPIGRSEDGLQDGCFWCCADVRYRRNGPSSTEWIMHDLDCPWAEGRRILGLPIDPHEVAPIETTATEDQ